DQFEELFTLCLDGGEREQFAQRLVEFASSTEQQSRLIITLRDDFLVRAETLTAFRQRLARALLLLATPPAAELRRILIEPARRAGYDFDDAALPDEMVAAVAEQPGALALLSFTAACLWQQRDRQFRQLTRRTYVEMGGVGGALAQHAEA